MLPAATVLAMDMISPRVGIAIAYVPAGPDRQKRSYLTRTIDGGSRWQLSGALPAAMTPSQTYEVAVAFSAPDLGYVSL